MDEPPVKLMIRTGGDKTTSSYRFRFENEWPLARTQWTKMYLKCTASAGQNERRDGRRARCSRSRRKPRSARYAASPPSHAGVSSSAPSHAAGQRGAHRHLVRDRAARRRHRDHRARSCSCCGCRARRRTWTSSRRSATSGPTARTSGKSASRAGRDAGDEGVAARVAPQARSGEVAAVPAVSRAHRAAVARRRARSSNARWRSGRRAWCSRKGHRIRLDIQPRDGVGASAYRTTTPTTTSARRTRSMPAGTRVSYLMLPVMPPKAGT